MPGDVAFECLKEWATRYVRYMDVSRRIAAVRDAGYGFEIINNDGTSSECVILPSLRQLNPDSVKGRNALVVALSNDDNIQAIYKAWDRLAQNSGLVLTLVNPFSKGDDKWVVKPFLHDRVCDRASLLQGLRAMAELVDPVDEAALALRLAQNHKS